MEQILSRRLAAVLCADIAGYSALISADESGAVAEQPLPRDRVHRDVRDMARQMSRWLSWGVHRLRPFIRSYTRSAVGSNISSTT